MFVDSLIKQLRLVCLIQVQAALERQDLSCTYLAHYELESVMITIIIIQVELILVEEGRHLDKVTLASTTAQSYTLSQRELLNPISLNLKRPIVHTSCQVNISQESKCPTIGVCRCNG